MAKNVPSSVEEYLAQRPVSTRAALETVRGAIRRALPHADEVIAYAIPAYKLDGKVALYFAGWKEHYSLYPAGDRVLAELRKGLQPYEVQRGTIRFPLNRPVPVTLIEKIAALRADDVLGRKKSKQKKQAQA
jgi:uncharacterized protein YdhG (YjbR/CyaY superfamily)